MSSVQADSSPVASPRLARERTTVAAMIRLFCRGCHEATGGLCSECEQLQAYALNRLAKCPFGEGKPNCVHCTIHCYKPQMREQIRVVMRYSGWRMMFRHPLLALGHMRDRKRAE